jgi:hypothetical protein
MQSAFTHDSHPAETSSAFHSIYWMEIATTFSKQWRGVHAGPNREWLLIEIKADYASRPGAAEQKQLHLFWQGGSCCTPHEEIVSPGQQLHGGQHVACFACRMEASSSSSSSNTVPAAVALAGVFLLHVACEASD